ncbi:MAG TPA: hypothetical protein VN376_07745 [Longilinea sp.]|nr:hypothetical protein [Longilinea sp.]
MNLDYETIRKRTQQYWYVDGISELGGGAALFLVGAFYLALELLSSSPLKAVLTGFLQPVIILGLIFACRYAVRKLKEKITYPRSGFVQYRERTSKRRWFVALVSGAVGALTTIGLSLASEWIRLTIIPVICGFFMSLLEFYIGSVIGVARFYWLAAVPLLTGIILSIVGVSDQMAIAILLGGTGLMWMISGAFVLAAYLKRYPLPAEGEV